MARYQRLLDMLAPLGLRIVQLVEDERGEMEVVLAGGMRIALGSEDFLGRMQRFITVYRGELAARAGDVARVDLRYSNGVAVSFREPPAAEHIAGL